MASRALSDLAVFAFLANQAFGARLFMLKTGRIRVMNYSLKKTSGGMREEKRLEADERGGSRGDYVLYSIFGGG